MATVAPSGTPIIGTPTIAYAFQSNTPGSIVLTMPSPTIRPSARAFACSSRRRR
jgi:hypothetical protein